MIAPMIRSGCAQGTAGDRGKMVLVAVETILPPQHTMHCKKRMNHHRLMGGISSGRETSEESRQTRTTATATKYEGLKFVPRAFLYGMKSI